MTGVDDEGTRLFPEKEYWMESWKRPTVIPVFYRLGVHECRRADLFEREGVGQLALREGYFHPKRQTEMSTAKALQCMKGLARFTGIEKEKEVLNDADCTESRMENKANNLHLIEQIVEAVLEARDKRESLNGRAEDVTPGVQIPKVYNC